VTWTETKRSCDTSKALCPEHEIIAWPLSRLDSPQEHGREYETRAGAECVSVLLVFAEEPGCMGGRGVSGKAGGMDARPEETPEELQADLVGFQRQPQLNPAPALIHVLEANCTDEQVESLDELDAGDVEEFALAVQDGWMSHDDVRVRVPDTILPQIRLWSGSDATPRQAPAQREAHEHRTAGIPYVDVAGEDDGVTTTTAVREAAKAEVELLGLDGSG